MGPIFSWILSIFNYVAEKKWLEKRNLNENTWNLNFLHPFSETFLTGKQRKSQIKMPYYIEEGVWLFDSN